MARTRIIGIALGTVVGATALLLATVMAGAGHGTYAPAKALFPFTMLSTPWTGKEISGAAIAWAFLQYPIYGLVLASAQPANRRRTAFVLAAVHIAVAGVTFAVLRGGGF